MNLIFRFFKDDNAWSKNQFSSTNPPTESNNTNAKPIETSKTTTENGQVVQTTSLSNGIETIDDKKALSKFLVKFYEIYAQLICLKVYYSIAF